jgi:hypothetical protein
MNFSFDIFDARFEIFTAVKIEFMVFWVVAPCSVVVEQYQRFRGPCCLQRKDSTTTLQGATAQKTTNSIHLRA